MVVVVKWLQTVAVACGWKGSKLIAGGNLKSKKFFLKWRIRVIRELPTSSKGFLAVWPAS